MTSVLMRGARRVARFVEESNPKRIYVMVSGGKDSAATALAVAHIPAALSRAYIIYNEIVGNTHPLNVKAVYELVDVMGVKTRIIVSSPEELRAAIKSVDPPAFIHVKAVSSRGRGFLDELVERGPPPFYQRRWCHWEFKARYWMHLPPEERDGRLYRFLVVGVRASESPARQQRWTSHIREFKAGKIVDVALSPLYDASSKEIDMIVKSAGLTHTLIQYARYGSSLGCILCPLRGYTLQARILRVLAAENPTFFEELRIVVEKMRTGGRLSSERKEKLLKAFRLASVSRLPISS